MLVYLYLSLQALLISANYKMLVATTRMFTVSGARRGALNDFKNSVGKELIDTVLDRLRKLADACSGLQGEFDTPKALQYDFLMAFCFV